MQTFKRHKIKTQNVVPLGLLGGAHLRLLKWSSLNKNLNPIKKIPIFYAEFDSAGYKSNVRLIYIKKKI